MLGGDGVEVRGGGEARLAEEEDAVEQRRDAQRVGSLDDGREQPRPGEGAAPSERHDQAAELNAGLLLAGSFTRCRPLLLPGQPFALPHESLLIWTYIEQFEMGRKRHSKPSRCCLPSRLTDVQAGFSSAHAQPSSGSLSTVVTASIVERAPNNMPKKNLQKEEE